MVLQEIGAPFELELITHHGEGADTHKPAFQKMNPKARVPVLTHGEFVLTESAAIVIHLASQHQDARLMPTGPDGLVRAVEWFNWLASAVHAVALRMVWRADFFSDDPSTHPAIVSKGHEHLAHAHASIEQRLQGHDYAVGDAYSIVDPYLLVYFRWGNRMRLDMAGLTMPCRRRLTSARLCQGSSPFEIWLTISALRERASTMDTSGQGPSGMSFGALPITRERKYQCFVPERCTNSCSPSLPWPSR